MALRCLISLAVILAAVSICSAAAFADKTFDAYGLAHFEKDGVSYGSDQPRMNLLAQPWSSSANLRYSSIVPFTELIARNERYMQDEALSGASDKERNSIFQQHITGGMGGSVVMIPDLSELSAAEKDQWRRIEANLASHGVSVPIYFVRDSSEFRQVYDTIETTGGSTGSSVLPGFLQWLEGHNFQLVASTAKQPRISAPKGTNIQGWLAGASKANGAPGATPTVVVMAHFDHLSIVPGMAEGVDDNASGTVALLELARLYHRLYKTVGSPAAYNLLFVLTSGAPINYQGAMEWLNAADDRLINTVELVLCLDTIGTQLSSEKLLLHASRPAKDPIANRLYESFKQAADQFDVEFAVQHYKVNIASSDIPWEHEHFSRRRLLGATLSRKAESKSSVTSSLLDARSTANVELLQRNIKFVAEALAKFLFSLDSGVVDVFTDHVAVDDKFIGDWVETLATAERNVGQVDPLLIKDLASGLGAFAGDISEQKFNLDKSFSFFSTAETTVSAFIVKPFFFDVFLSLGVAGYLAALYFGVQMSGYF